MTIGFESEVYTYLKWVNDRERDRINIFKLSPSDSLEYWFSDPSLKLLTERQRKQSIILVAPTIAA